MSDDLLADLVAAVVTPGTMAHKRGLTLRDLARWASDPENRETLGALQSLADAQAGLVISRARAQAAKRLLVIAKNKDAPETARKACVDLLGLRSGVNASDAGDDVEAAWREDVRAILASVGTEGSNSGSRA